MAGITGQKEVRRPFGAPKRAFSTHGAAKSLRGWILHAETPFSDHGRSGAVRGWILRPERGATRPNRVRPRHRTPEATHPPLHRVVHNVSPPPSASGEHEGARRR